MESNSEDLTTQETNQTLPPQTEEASVEDSLLDAFKSEFGKQEQEDSSLTNDSETEAAEESSEEATPETPSTVQQDESNESEETLQEKSEEVSTQSTEELQKELEELRKFKEEQSSKTTEVDLEWFKSEEGKLWQRDLDNVSIEDSWQDLLAEKLVSEEGFTYEEAMEELEDRYPELYDDDIDDDDKDFQKAVRRVTKDSRLFLEKLKERQKEIEIPFKQKSASEQDSTKGEQIAKEDFDNVYKERLTQDYQQRANSRAQIADNLFKGKQQIEVSFGDTKLEYKLTPEVVQKAKQTLVDLENIGSSFVDSEKGEIKNQDLMEFLLFKNDRQTFLDMYANVKVAEAKENLIKNEIKNSNFEQKSTKASKVGAISEDDPDYAILKGLSQGDFR